ncbi:MAG: hypothetical protein UT66_C0033G0005 [candidate division CPR2 bacterium GW2011_GWC1_39_9]|uniref:Uncharacterized protein n=1 Tax=candidate division CPR2 bacterium GW2011_GWC2_39_10 TaxID=1618345 RepID=A0A0G0M0L8_UNCC2|nr:MAG: hypothetical protein UT18_C0015G0014 [candidate division CPR2 bacterium GW2011_GWC2_39_10]KKR33855.1 MAG: hypothetical protein UT66_C0033G0005 [candidate division CPR2 bacterium GW2011_GWC1_39_9]
MNFYLRNFGWFSIAGALIIIVLSFPSFFCMVLPGEPTSREGTVNKTAQIWQLAAFVFDKKDGPQTVPDLACTSINIHNKATKKSWAYPAISKW